MFNKLELDRFTVVHTERNQDKFTARNSLDFDTRFKLNKLLNRFSNLMYLPLDFQLKVDYNLKELLEEWDDLKKPLMKLPGVKWDKPVNDGVYFNHELEFIPDQYINDTAQYSGNGPISIIRDAALNQLKLPFENIRSLSVLEHINDMNPHYDRVWSPAWPSCFRILIWQENPGIPFWYFKCINDNKKYYVDFPSKSFLFNNQLMHGTENVGRKLLLRINGTLKIEPFIELFARSLSKYKQHCFYYNLPTIKELEELQKSFTLDKI